MVMAQRAMMEDQFRHQQAQHALAMQRMDPAFLREQERMKSLETEFQKATINVEAEAWVLSTLTQKNEAVMEDKFEENKLAFEEEQARIKSATSNMLNIMSEDEDPRFKNSQFLNFIKRINQGELVISGQEITETKPDLEGAWNASENINDMQTGNLENAFKKQKE